jgi:Tol biopolymer transport system component
MKRGWNVWLQVIGSVVLMSVLLAACGGGTVVSPAPPSASKAAVDLKVMAQRDLKIDNTRILSLSPDGKWLAAIRDRSACIIAVDTLADKVCAEMTTGPLDSRSFVWSPDSQRLAFTEDLLRYMYESDIWMLSVDNGQLTDLTPDGIFGSVLKLPQDSATTLDSMPGWSPDSQTLIFSRSDRANGSTTLYRISVKGGSPEKILDIAGSGPIAVWYGPRWLGNGKIVYTINHPKQSEPTNGIWLADSNGQNAKQLLAPDQQLGAPFLADVSATGDRAMVFYSGAFQYAAHTNVSYWALLDLTSGQTVPLKPAAEFLYVANATFSPDGSKIIYIYRTADNQTQVMVRDVPSGTDNSLLTQSTLLGTTTDSTVQGLGWVNNDTVYAAAAPGAGTLLTLGNK